MATLVDAFNRKTWGESDEAYFAYVDRVLARGKNERFNNGKPWHAAYLIFKFLQYAERHVRLFSGTLVRVTPSGVPVYGASHIVEAACDFLRREDSKLHIVLEKDVPGEDLHEHPLIEGVKSLKHKRLLRGTLEVRTILPKAANLLRSQDVLHHMMLVDKRRWRIEIDADPNEVKAIVNAGNAKETTALCKAFDASIWNGGPTICLVQPETQANEVTMW